MDKECIIQEFVSGKQVMLVYLIVYLGVELVKKIGVFEFGVIGIMMLMLGEMVMIVGDLVMKVVDVYIGFFDWFSGVLVIYGLVGVVEEVFLQIIGGLGCLLNYILCELMKS